MLPEPPRRLEPSKQEMRHIGSEGLASALAVRCRSLLGTVLRLRQTLRSSRLLSRIGQSHAQYYETANSTRTMRMTWHKALKASEASDSLSASLVRTCLLAATAAFGTDGAVERWRLPNTKEDDRKSNAALEH